MTDNQRKVLYWLLDVGVNVVIIVSLVFVIQKWIVAPFDVSGSSMCDTLNFIDGECQNGKGERIIINEAGYVFGEPQRGDIVVFKAPKEEGEEERYFIKRIIGIPGDKVELIGGRVHLTTPGSDQSTQLKEEYLNSENQGNTDSILPNFSVFEVPENKYFLLGDNRRASTDSRLCFSRRPSTECKNNPERAFIHIDDIRGKAWLSWWPLSSIRIINHEYSESLAEK